MLKDVRKASEQVWMRFRECVTTDDDGIHEEWCCSEDGKTKCGEEVGTPEEPRICRSRFAADQQRTCRTSMAETRVCNSGVKRLVFTPDNWNVPQKIFVGAIDDDEYEVKGHEFEVRLCHVAATGPIDCSKDSDAVVIKGITRENEADSTTDLEEMIDAILNEVCTHCALTPCR